MNPEPRKISARQVLKQQAKSLRREIRKAKSFLKLREQVIALHQELTQLNDQIL